MAQQGSQGLPQGLPQQQAHHQQQQQRLERRSSGPGPRNNGFKQPNHNEPHIQSSPTPGMHYPAGYNGVASAPQSYNMQQQAYTYPQAGYYPQYQHQGMMVPQGSYPHNYPGSQQQAGRSQPTQSQYPGRTSQPAARPQPAHQPPQPPAQAVPAIRKKKALDIIDPATHSKVEISPRSKSSAHCLEQIGMALVRSRFTLAAQGIDLVHDIGSVTEAYSWPEILQS